MYTELKALLQDETMNFGEVIYLIAFDGVREYRELGATYFDRVLDREGLDGRAEAVVQRTLAAREGRLIRGLVQGETLSDVARSWGTTRQRVGQILTSAVRRLQRPDVREGLATPDTELWRKLPKDVCLTLMQQGLDAYEEVLAKKPAELAVLLAAAGFRRAIWVLLAEARYLERLDLADMLVILALDSGAYARARRGLMEEVKGSTDRLAKVAMLDELRRIEESFDLLPDGVPRMALPTVERDERSVKVLGLPVRIEHALLRQHIRTVGELKALGSEELLRVRNLGRYSVDAILVALRELEARDGGEREPGGECEPSRPSGVCRSGDVCGLSGVRDACKLSSRVIPL